MTAGSALRFVLRESRGSRGRLAFLVACLSLGVAAVVAVSGLARSLDEGIRTDAKQLLAADFAISGRRPLPDAAADAIRAIPGALRTDVKETPTVVVAPAGNSLLVELKAVGPGYPFYGALKLDPDLPPARLLDDEGALVAPELLSRLGLAVGDELRIGGVPFTIRGRVLSEPDRVRVSFTLGPRVLVSAEGFARSGLAGFGSRIGYRTLVKLPGDWDRARIDEAAKQVLARIPESDGLEVETFSEAQPALREGLRRAERFLGLVALLSLLVGGVGVAETVRAWIASRMDSIAVLKCLGARPREILGLYLGETLLLGIAGSAVGAIAGSLVTLAAPLLLRSLLPAVEVRAWQPMALARGVGLGIAVAVLFGLLPVLAALRVRPARVLRRDAEPLPLRLWIRLLALAALVAGVFGAAWTQSRSASLGAGFTIGLAAAALILALAAFVTTRLVARLSRGRARIWLRHGLAASARPGSGSLPSIVSLGLGVLVVLGMYLVHTRLTAQFAADVPRDAPTSFLVDIQPDQWDEVKRRIEGAGAAGLNTVPIVRARLAAIDGRDVAALAAEGQGGSDRRRWVLTREQNLTYLDRLPEGNAVVEGKLWSDPEHEEISIEQEFARDLGVKLGTVLRFDVQGVLVDLTVTSLRTVNWKTFGINFFLIVEPGVLEGAPQARVATMRLPADAEQRLQDSLVATFPNVTLLKVREILEKIVSLLDRLGLGIRLVGGFTVLAGIAILAGAVSAGSERRGREVALLKTLGMTRGQVMAVFAVEYAVLGAVAGAVGAVGALVLAWAVVTRGMELSYRADPAACAVAFAATIALAIAAGIGASARSLSRRPVEVLRDE